jgi:hypothetical protein
MTSQSPTGTTAQDSRLVSVLNCGFYLVAAFVVVLIEVVLLALLLAGQLAGARAREDRVSLARGFARAARDTPRLAIEGALLLADALADVRKHDHDLASAYKQDPVRDSADRDRVPGRWPEIRAARLASLLAAMAARLVPAGDRPRYAEEFRSELWEITQAGADHRRQLGCAARQVLAAVHLWFVLRAPRRRSAAP